jgi:hypothetical protein
MDVYSGTVPDPALYDRFLKIKFRPTVPEWLTYAEDYGVHRAILSYINKIPADLMPEAKQSVKAGEYAPTPRSWVSLSDCITYMIEQDADPMKDWNYFHLLSQGYLGSTVATNFKEFVMNNYKVYSPLDILEKFDKSVELQDAFDGMLPAEAAYYTAEMVKYIKKVDKNLTKKQGTNLFLWIKAMNQEIAGAFWRDFIVGATQKIARHWYITSDGVQDYIFSKLDGTFRK